jgi:hypothetical protein
MNPSNNPLSFRHKLTLAVSCFILILFVPLLISISEKKCYKTECTIASAILNKQKKKAKIISRKMIMEAIKETERQTIAGLLPAKTFRLKKISFPYLDDDTDYIKLTIYFYDSTGMKDFLNNIVATLNDNAYVKKLISIERDRAARLNEELHSIENKLQNIGNIPFISSQDKMNQQSLNALYLRLKHLLEHFETNQQHNFDFYLVLSDNPIIYPGNFSRWVLTIICFVIGSAVSYLILKLL